MFKLATPISHLFKDPTAKEEIIAASDCLEGREHTRESREAKQWLFHFDIQIIHPWAEREKELIGQVAARKELKVISFHMASVCSRPVLVNGMFQPGGENFSRQQMIDFAKQNAAWLKTIGKGLKIAVENNNHYPTPAYQDVTDVDFISQVVNDNGLNFLFDMAHAQIAAHNRGKNYEEYLAGLPMDKMIQIHVSKHIVNEDNLAVDAHVLPDETVLKDVAEIVRRHDPEYLTIEYYKDKDDLIKLLGDYQQLKLTLAR